MSDVFFDTLDIPRPNYNLGVGSGSHGRQTADMMRGLEEVLEKESPNLLLVYGDTNSTLAGALVAAKMGIPLGHVEAGLRSFNRQMPEEVNRVVADHLSSLLFAPIGTAVDYLDFIALLMGSSKVVTDSGGVQKEAYFFGVPCVTLRDETEWIETLEDGWNALVGTDTDEILHAIEKFNPEGTKSKSFGDGHAAEKIARILDKFV